MILGVSYGIPKGALTFDQSNYLVSFSAVTEFVYLRVFLSL